ncbi:MAG: DUF748 domain-containing protein [Candidatus Omnitrophota bacterium]|nr:DUF748 domain-containing protein [Candidatus Omnitrophota bacterium]
MKKKIFIIFIILVVTISGIITYLNLKILPTKIKALIVGGLEEATQKKVILGSVSLNIFKGLVLRDLIIYDGNVAIFNAKETSCVFLILPVFKKEIIIPYVTIRSPELFVERLPDGSVNIMDLFRKPLLLRKRGFKIFVYKIEVRDARVNFHDNTLDPPFVKEIKKLDLKLALSLPNKVKFDLDAEASSDHPIRLSLSGEYDMLRKELTAAANIKDLPPKDFERYYNNAAFPLPQGSLDAGLSLRYKDNVLGLDLDAKSARLLFAKDGFSASLDSAIKSNFKYDFTDRALKYNGGLHVNDLKLSGVPGVGNIENVKGDIIFSDSGLSSDNISASAFGVPVRAGIKITDFNELPLDIDLSSDLGLAALQKILKDNFAVHLPAEVRGEGRIHITMRYKIPEARVVYVNGSLDVLGAAADIGRNKANFNNINGKVEFTPNQVKWSGLTFKHIDKEYGTSGTLTNFEAPGVQMELYSEGLSLNTVFAVNGGLLTFSKFAGRYHDSEFSMSGDMDISDSAELKGDIKGVLDVELADLKEPLKKFEERLEKLKPSGRLRADFSLAGNVRDIKSCAIEARLSAERLSVRDFKFSDFAMSYVQKNGVADVISMRLSLYGGEITAAGRIDLVSADMPYSASADIQGLRLERLKTDTAFRDNDISGSLRAKAEISGPSNDISRLEGAGRINITDGKLWQLNLFKGLGILLFSRDFSNIVFSEGSCDFLIKDKSISTDNIMFKSGLIYMYGAIKLGFDKSINAALKAQIEEEAVESGAAVRNVTAAIEKYSFIEITGTLKEPKYRIAPDVADILEDLKNMFF